MGAGSELSRSAYPEAMHVDCVKIFNLKLTMTMCTLCLQPCMLCAHSGSVNTKSLLGISVQTRYLCASREPSRSSSSAASPGMQRITARSPCWCCTKRQPSGTGNQMYNRPYQGCNERACAAA